MSFVYTMRIDQNKWSFLLFVSDWGNEYINNAIKAESEEHLSVLDGVTS